MAMSMPMLLDTAHKALARAYVRMPVTSTGLRPYRSLAGPNASSPTAKNRKYPTSVRFTIASDVSKCSVMCGTAGVYMSSDRGVTSEVMTSSAMRPSGPSRRCGRVSHE